MSVEDTDANFSIRTAQGDVQLTQEVIKGLLDGTIDTILVGGQPVQAEEFLMQDARHIQRDLLAMNTFQLITDEAEAMMEQQIRDNHQMGGM